MDSSLVLKPPVVTTLKAGSRHQMGPCSQIAPKAAPVIMRYKVVKTAASCRRSESTFGNIRSRSST